MGRRKQRGREAQPEPPVSLQLIADKLDRLTWRHRPMGVDERQVWHVIRRLDEMYRQLYREQEVRYEALLEQARAGSQAVGSATAVAPTVSPATAVAPTVSSAERAGILPTSSKPPVREVPTPPVTQQPPTSPPS